MFRLLINLFLGLLFYFSSISVAQSKEKILLVGNSFTYFNEMPETLQKMFDESNIDIHVSVMVRAGASLRDHLVLSYHHDTGFYAPQLFEEPQTIRMIRSEKWDYVVLQERPINILVHRKRGSLHLSLQFYGSIAL